MSTRVLQPTHMLTYTFKHTQWKMCTGVCEDKWNELNIFGTFMICKLVKEEPRLLSVLRQTQFTSLFSSQRYDIVKLMVIITRGQALLHVIQGYLFWIIARNTPCNLMLRGLSSLNCPSLSVFPGTACYDTLHWHYFQWYCKISSEGREKDLKNSESSEDHNIHSNFKSIDDEDV